MNYNSSSGSQLMPDSWIEMTGATEEPEAKGDFISLVSRTGPEKVDTLNTKKIYFLLLFKNFRHWTFLELLTIEAIWEFLPCRMFKRF